MGVRIVHSGEDLGAYKSMTFPGFRPLIENFTQNSSLVIAVADHQGQAAGMLLCQLNAVSKKAEILSIFVKKAFRKLGLAIDLVRLVEDDLANRGYQSAELKYTIDTAKAAPLENLLKKLSWPKPSIRMALFDISIDKLISAKWVQDFKESQDQYRITLWQDVSELEVARLQRASWVPEELSPAKHQTQGLDGKAVLPELCFVLRHADEIIGWHFTHKLDEETARFSVSYVHPDYQHDLLLLKLWYHAGIEAKKAGYKKVRLGASIRHKQMMQFCERFLSPLASKVEYSKGAFKLLQKQEEAVWV